MHFAHPVVLRGFVASEQVHIHGLRDTFQDVGWPPRVLCQVVPVGRGGGRMQFCNLRHAIHQQPCASSSQQPLAAGSSQQPASITVVCMVRQPTQSFAWPVLGCFAGSRQQPAAASSRPQHISLHRQADPAVPLATANVWRHAPCHLGRWGRPSVACMQMCLGV